MSRSSLASQSVLFMLLGLGLLFADACVAQESAVADKAKTAAKQESTNTKTKDDAQDEKATAEVAQKKDKDQDDKSDSETKPRKQPKISVAEIELGGTLSEGPSQTGLLGADDNASLMSMIKRLHKAKDDNKVRSVLIRLKGAALGRGQLHEVRQAITDVRDAGKMVYANVEMAMPSDYLVACACDKIMMPESGILLLPGVRAEVAFYKNLLDKLDIEADMMQIGDFKGAAEPMTRTQMSESFQKQLKAVLADYYDQMVEIISTDRSLTDSQVKRIIDKGVHTAEAAKEAGLIDIVDYEEAWEQELLAGSKDHQLAMLEDYGKKKVDTDFSGMGGFIKMMEMLSGGRKSTKKSKQDKKIAVVYAVGAITSGKSSSNPFMGGQTMGSDTIVEALTEADEDESVAAIVLRVDSPGGSALASDLIWNKIQKIEKPVIASMGNVAASGGYYISMGCDKIYAEPGTLTGSIGVVGGKIVTKGLMDRIGVTTDVIAFGDNSGMFSPNERFSDSSRKLMKQYMTDTYEQFTEKAAAGRKMKLDKLLSLAGGRVWTGRQAKDNDLIDELGTLKDAIRDAQKIAKLKSDEEPNLLILPEQKTIFEELFSGASAETPLAATGSWQQLMPQPLRAQLADIQVLQRVFREPAACILPGKIEIK